MQMLAEQLTNPILGPIYAVVAGILTSASPCAIGAMPLVIGHMAGADGKARIRDLALFVFGMSFTLTVAGLGVGLLSKSVSLSAPWVRVIVGASFAALGLVYMGILGGSRTCPAGPLVEDTSSQRSWLASVSMGLLYGVSASPCATPALIAILALVATTGSAVRGGVLLLAYSLGQALLVVIAGLATSKLKDFLTGDRSAALLPFLRRTGGVIILVFGLYMAVSQLILMYH